jgi:hypothetical protein
MELFIQAHLTRESFALSPALVKHYRNMLERAPRLLEELVKILGWIYFSLNFCPCKRGVRHECVDEAISGKEVVYLLCVQHLMLVYLRQVYPCGYVPSVWAACALQAGKWWSLAMLYILVSVQLHLKYCDYIVVCCVVFVEVLLAAVHILFSLFDLKCPKKL